MDSASLAIIALMTIGVLIVVSFPVWVSWFVAHRSRLPARRLFVLVCTLFAFGCLTLTGAVLLPLEMTATWVAPELHTAGHRSLANAIFITSEHGVPVACFIVGFLASLVIPSKLRRFWPAIAAAIGANNSSRPTPLRGAA
jgi:hypothetical protein